jgi:hemolysin activation/secretion protein
MRSIFLRLWLACGGLLLLLPVVTHAARDANGPLYPVSAFAIEYALDHPRHLDERDVLDLEVGLTAAEAGYVAPRPVDRTVRLRLSSLPRNAYFSATAIQHINQYIVSSFNRRGYNGVIVTVPDIEEGTGRDLRAPNETTLRLQVWTGRVSRVTSLADGERYASLSSEERTDHPNHGWIRDRAPVQPGGLRGLLDVAAAEDYAAKLSRHPGRRVDVELSPGTHPGTSNVNLRVAENKPWRLYAQYSNTGTSSTTKNRQRIGLVHTQLLGRDDVMSLEYATGDFDEVHAVSGSYTTPISQDVPELRMRLSARYAEFDAAEVDFTDSRFIGDQALGQIDFAYNAYQYEDFFLDVIGGVRFQHITFDNKLQGVNDSADFWVPRLGLRGERNTQTSQLRLGAGLELGFTDSDLETLTNLGNPEPAEEFAVLRWDGRLAFYLEPLLDRQAWEDPETPGSSTLAHEVVLSTRGQWAFNYRLIPQYQQTAGGLFSVRGYKQAAIAGDNLVLGTAEYRLHLPRLLDPDPEPPVFPLIGEFRLRPRSIYGRPDWDFVMKLFSDAGRVHSNRRFSSEAHETLVSIGGGIEMQLFRNLKLQLDAGHVLDSVGSSESGDTRGHVLATLAY